MSTREEIENYLCEFLYKAQDELKESLEKGKNRPKDYKAPHGADEIDYHTNKAAQHAQHAKGATGNFSADHSKWSQYHTNKAKRLGEAVHKIPEKTAKLPEHKDSEVKRPAAPAAKKNIPDLHTIPDPVKKTELIKALLDAGQTQSAMLLKNWDEMDYVAEEFAKADTGSKKGPGVTKIDKFKNKNSRKVSTLDQEVKELKRKTKANPVKNISPDSDIAQAINEREKLGKAKKLPGKPIFSMDHVTSATKQDHNAAKASAHEVINASGAQEGNKAKARQMVDSSKNHMGLLTGMTNFTLAHDNKIRSRLKGNKDD